MGKCRNIAPFFLTLVLDGGEWSASGLCRFTFGEEGPGTHWLERWIGPRVGLDAVEERKTCTAGNRTRPPRCYIDRANPTPPHRFINLSD
jgi:hypothetical protein